MRRNITVVVNLETVRKLKRMTQEELADASGVSLGYISKIENGKAIPTLTTICKLAYALKVCTCSLYYCESNSSG